MSKVKEAFNLEGIFGDLSNFVIRTNLSDAIRVGRKIKITNPNCEWEYDCVAECFTPTMYAYIVDLDLIDVDLSDYAPNLSNNGGRYAYAIAVIKEIKEKGY